MKASPSEALPKASIPSLGAFLTQGTNPALAARSFLQTGREALAENFAPGKAVTPLLRQTSDMVDTVLTRLWLEYVGENSPATLIAVGGYGRGELFPQSDIDVLILTQETPDADSAGQLEQFVTSLWDTGLQIGHSVRTLAECAELAREDLTVVTTMMESRHLAGDTGLIEALAVIIDPSAMWPPNDFIRGKLGEQQNRHDRYSNTEYALEPNIKSSPGGLRDLQVIEWITLRCFGEGLSDVNEPNFLSETERDQLRNGQEFLSQVRFALHNMTGRADDRLLFDHQKKLAALWGMVDGDTLAVEQFMQVYYRWMKTLSQLNELLIEVFEHRLADTADSDIRVIDDDF